MLLPVVSVCLVQFFGFSVADVGREEGSREGNGRYSKANAQAKYEANAYGIHYFLSLVREVCPSQGDDRVGNSNGIL